MTGTTQTATRSVQLRVMSTPTSSLTDALAVARRQRPTGPGISRGLADLRSLGVPTAA